MERSNISKLFAVVATLLSAAGLSGCGFITGEKQAVGQVVSFGPHGFWCSPNEGEFALATFRGGKSGGKTTTTIDFAVANDSIAKQITDAMNNQTPIEITYTEHNSAPFWSCTQDQADVVTAVRALDKPVEGPGIKVGPLGKSVADDNDDGASGSIRGDIELICRPKAAPSPN